MFAYIVLTSKSGRSYKRLCYLTDNFKILYLPCHPRLAEYIIKKENLPEVRK